MGLPMLRLNLQFWLPNFILVSAFPLPFMNIYLQWTTQTRTLGRRLSQHFLETKDSQVFLQTDQ